MKTPAVAFSLIALALSGCAHTGYQSGYVDYNSGYSVERYYDYPARAYYPSGNVGYSRYYVPTYQGHHYSHDHDRHDSWQHREQWQPRPQRRQDHDRDDRRRWEHRENDQRRSERRNDRDSQWQAQAQRQQLDNRTERSHTNVHELNNDRAVAGEHTEHRPAGHPFGNREHGRNHDRH